MNSTTRILLAAAICASLAACTKKTKEEPTGPVSEPARPAEPGPVSDGKFTPADLDSNACLRQRVVYFDFDKSDIRPEFTEIMACHAKYLRDRPMAAMSLEGHADERGTREYNMGLGERRSNAVGDALKANGGSASQISNVSYGEERPTCNDSNDGCWSKNRRVEIVYTAK